MGMRVVFDGTLPKTHQAVGLRLSEDREKDMISDALAENLWIQKDAAIQLGLSPRALNYRIKKLGITHSRWRKKNR